MAGNVSEWVADIYLPDAYRPGKKYRPALIQRSVRGGNALGTDGRIYQRHGIPPDSVSETVGFRCAMTADLHGTGADNPR
jgi:formylglycine-generating enzyme required for sulfatase activity